MKVVSNSFSIQGHISIKTADNIEKGKCQTNRIPLFIDASDVLALFLNDEPAIQPNTRLVEVLSIDVDYR